MTRRSDRRPFERANAYKLCSLALQYPDEELLAGRDELVAAVAELPRGQASEALERFFTWYARTPALKLAQHYVRTFASAGSFCCG